MAEILVGDIVRLVAMRTHVPKADAGMLVTVRSVTFRADFGRQLIARVDNGDPAIDDMRTNGATYAALLPVAALAPLGDCAEDAARLRREAGRMLALATRLEASRG